MLLSLTGDKEKCSREEEVWLMGHVLVVSVAL